jgi:hypothetical protein
MLFIVTMMRLVLAIAITLSITPACACDAHNKNAAVSKDLGDEMSKQHRQLRHRHMQAELIINSTLVGIESYDNPTSSFNESWGIEMTGVPPLMNATIAAVHTVDHDPAEGSTDRHARIRHFQRLVVYYLRFLLEMIFPLALLLACMTVITFATQWLLRRQGHFFVSRSYRTQKYGWNPPRAIPDKWLPDMTAASTPNTTTAAEKTPSTSTPVRPQRSNSNHQHIPSSRPRSSPKKVSAIARTLTASLSPPVVPCTPAAVTTTTVEKDDDDDDTVEEGYDDANGSTRVVMAYAWNQNRALDDASLPRAQRVDELEEQEEKP